MVLSIDLYVNKHCLKVIFKYTNFVKPIFSDYLVTGSVCDEKSPEFGRCTVSRGRQIFPQHTSSFDPAIVDIHHPHGLPCLLGCNSGLHCYCR